MSFFLFMLKKFFSVYFSFFFKMFLIFLFGICFLVFFLVLQFSWLKVKLISFNFFNIDFFNLRTFILGFLDLQLSNLNQDIDTLVYYKDLESFVFYVLFFVRNRIILLPVYFGIFVILSILVYLVVKNKVWFLSSPSRFYYLLCFVNKKFFRKHKLLFKKHNKELKSLNFCWTYIGLIDFIANFVLFIAGLFFTGVVIYLDPYSLKVCGIVLLYFSFVCFIGLFLWFIYNQLRKIKF